MRWKCHWMYSEIMQSIQGSLFLAGLVLSIWLCLFHVLLGNCLPGMLLVFASLLNGRDHLNLM